MPGSGPPTTAQSWCRNHSHRGDAVDKQRNERRPHWHASHKVFRAINRVDNPLPTSKFRGAPKFFPHNCVVGVLLRNQPAQLLFAGDVGVGHGCHVGLR